jgi:hypothetical protein
MSKPQELVEDILDDELADLDSAGVDLPSSIQARLRKHDSQRKIPREREGGEGRARVKPVRPRHPPD